METNKIKALMSAINAGSLMRASESLGYTSSGLTHMMNSLEQELHVTLLDRSPAGIIPTEECRRLMPFLERLVQDEERLNSELELMRQQKKRLIRLGIFSSTSRNMVPQLIKEYISLHPDTSFHLQVGGKEDMADWLSTDKVDAAVCSQVYGSKYSFVPILHDQYFAVLPTSNPRARSAALSWTSCRARLSFSPLLARILILKRILLPGASGSKPYPCRWTIRHSLHGFLRSGRKHSLRPDGGRL